MASVWASQLSNVYVWFTTLLFQKTAVKVWKRLNEAEPHEAALHRLLAQKHRMMFVGARHTVSKTLRCVWGL